MPDRPGKVMDLIGLLNSKCHENEMKVMKQSGLSVSEFRAIDTLSPGEVVSGKSLSQKMGLSPSRASRVVERMVRNGFLIREYDPRDRRRCNLELSEKGIGVKKKIETMRTGCEQKFSKIFSRQEFSDFTAGIEKTIKIL